METASPRLKSFAKNTKIVAELVGTPQTGTMMDPFRERSERTESRHSMRLAMTVRRIMCGVISSRLIPDLHDETGACPEIVNVTLASDLKRATVTYLPPLVVSNRTVNKARYEKNWQKRFEKSRGELKKVLGEQIRSRGPPDLEFVLATDVLSVEASNREKLLDKLRELDDIDDDAKPV